MLDSAVPTLCMLRSRKERYNGRVHIFFIRACFVIPLGPDPLGPNFPLFDPLVGDSF
jgi:hypothetical protein